MSVGYGDFLETLPAPLAIGGVTLPVGSYHFDALRAGYNMGQQRALSANITLEHGTFYNGRKTTFGIARGRALITDQLSVEPTYSINKVDLVEGGFTTHLLGTRATYTATPLMFVSALVQYNSSTHTSRPMPGSAGSTCRAASCSSSTTRTATRWCRTGPLCRAARSS